MQIIKTSAKRILLLTVIIFFPASNIHAENGAAAFLNVPVGARAAALGGAYVAMSHDASAVYWNPASLGGVYSLSLVTSTVSAKIGDNGSFGDLDTRHVFVALAFPISKYGTLGLGWKNFSNGDIEYRGSNGEQLGVFDDNENAFFAAYGYDLVRGKAGVGLSFKYIRQEFTTLDEATASGQGFSFGMYYQPNDHLKLALRADDDIRIEWENGHTDTTLFRGVAGAVLTVWHERLNFVVDLEQARDRALKGSTGVEFHYQTAKVYGFEHFLVTGLSLRAGLDDVYLENRHGVDFQKQTNFTYGFGIGAYLEGLFLNIDYSYGRNRIGNQNRISLSLSF